MGDVDGPEKLSHVADDGRARMVDVGGKAVTSRRAVASGRVVMRPETRRVALESGGPKGPVFEVARLAGIGAAKRTDELIPLCHSLPVDGVDVTIAPEGDDALVIRAAVTTSWRTGVEMEALTAVSVTALTIIDMLKAIEKTIEVRDVRLEEKTGGKSGDWRRPA